MKTFSDFILEARGGSNERIIQTRGKIELLRTQMSSTDDPERKAEIKKQIRRLQSLLPTPGKGRPQKERDVITSGKTTLGTIANVPRSGTVTSGEIVSGRHTDVSSRSQKGGRVSLRNRAVSREGDNEGRKGPA